MKTLIAVCSVLTFATYSLIHVSGHTTVILTMAFGILATAISAVSIARHYHHARKR